MRRIMSVSRLITRMLILSEDFINSNARFRFRFLGVQFSNLGRGFMTHRDRHSVVANLLGPDEFPRIIYLHSGLIGARYVSTVLSN